MSKVTISILFYYQFICPVFFLVTVFITCLGIQTPNQQHRGLLKGSSAGAMLW